MLVHDEQTLWITDAEQDIVDLLTRMTPRLKRILASFRVPAADAEDLLQEACLALVRSWRRIDCPEAWLRQTLYRICYLWATRRRRAWLQYLDGVFLEALAPAQRPAQERAELFWDVQALLAHLPRRCRILLQLRYGLGLSSEEIAARLGYRPESIRTLSARAVARLRHAAQAPRRG